MSLSLAAMDVAYERFLIGPDKKSYLRLRELMLVETGLVRRWSDLQRLERYPDFASNDAAATDRYWQMAADLAPAWRLCTRYHYVLALAAKQQGDAEELELERFQLSACLDGILSTGDGSPSAPYRVLHTSDIYDVLFALCRTPVAQHFAQSQEDVRDIITCDDGNEWHFERGDLCLDDESLPFTGLLINRLSELNF